MPYPDLVGRPWREAEPMLQAEGLRYVTVMTCPTRDFFETDEQKLYVVRTGSCADGKWEIVLAARVKSHPDFPCI